jgi:hypothetical protein
MTKVFATNESILSEVSATVHHIYVVACERQKIPCLLHNVSIPHCFSKDEQKTHCGAGQTVLLVSDSGLEMVRVQTWYGSTGCRFVKQDMLKLCPWHREESTTWFRLQA